MDDLPHPRDLLGKCARCLLDSVLDATRVREMPQERSIEFISCVFFRDSPATGFESRWLKWDSVALSRGRFVRLKDGRVVYAIPGDSRDLSSELEGGDLRIAIPDAGARMLRTRVWREAVPDVVLRVADQWKQVLSQTIVVDDDYDDDLAKCHICGRPAAVSRCVTCSMHYHDECARGFVEWAESNTSVAEDVESAFCNATLAGGCARAMIAGRPDFPGGGLPNDGFAESWHEATCDVCKCLLVRAGEEEGPGPPEEGA